MSNKPQSEATSDVELPLLERGQKAKRTRSEAFSTFLKKNKPAPSPSQPEPTSKTQTWRERLYAWWKAVRPPLDYIWQFFMGFLQPGWPGLLSAFILHIMQPWTTAAYLFVGISVACGFAMMALKGYSDHVNSLGMKLTTMTEALHGIKDRLNAFSQKYLSQENGLLAEVALELDPETYPNLINVLKERGANVQSHVITKGDRQQLKQDLAQKVTQSDAALQELAQFRQQTRLQALANFTMGLITLVGSIGVPFFVFLTINGAATPITVVPMLLEVTATVVGFATIMGFFQLGVYLDNLLESYSARKAQEAALVKCLDQVDEAYQKCAGDKRSTKSIAEAIDQDKAASLRSEVSGKMGLLHFRSPQKGSRHSTGQGGDDSFVIDRTPLERASEAEGHEYPPMTPVTGNRGLVVGGKE